MTIDRKVARGGCAQTSNDNNLEARIMIPTNPHLEKKKPQKHDSHQSHLDESLNFRLMQGENYLMIKNHVSYLAKTFLTKDYKDWAFEREWFLILS
jgi:hypothetical protein